MARAHDFEHLSLVLRQTGDARFKKPDFSPDSRTSQAKANRTNHSHNLRQPAVDLIRTWRARQEARDRDGLPILPQGVPLLLQIDEGLDIDTLRRIFEFEIISEQTDGYVLVAAEDIDLNVFFQRLDEFEEKVHGSGAVASIHSLGAEETQEDRLKRILSETLFDQWNDIDNDALYVVDIGVACLGTLQTRAMPKRGRMREATWQAKLEQWEQETRDVHDAWDQLRDERYTLVRQFVQAYDGEILANIDGNLSPGAHLPDSFTLRLRIVGAGLKDLILNCAYVFEVVEPENFETPQAVERRDAAARENLELVPPETHAPRVCILDSGVQEGHFWIAPAIELPKSRSLLPGNDDVSDRCRPGGHGTRVAGAVLYGENIPTTGRHELRTWIQNARVLDDNSVMPIALPPANAMRDAVSAYCQGETPTRIFNCSINANGPCRLRHMSAWAAEIDHLSYSHDILFVQSAGNIPDSRPAPLLGVAEMHAATPYPRYSDMGAARIANPAQSLQAITVGSVGYGAFEDPNWRAFVTRRAEPSSFSRAGLGIWGSIKPDVVEFGGDLLYMSTNPPRVGAPQVGAQCYPELLRSTLYEAPAFARDGIGTSFAAPKVSRIASEIQRTLPQQSCLLYRALIALSASWPEWSHGLTVPEQQALLKRIGYGLPDVGKATQNTDHRVTYITEVDRHLSSGQCDVYQVRIPPEVRGAGDEYDIKIEVALSYVAEPRRTRQRHRGYLAVWLDWISSKRNESIESFADRALKDEEPAGRDGQVLRWTLDEQDNYGILRDVRRSIGTLQKDWTTIKSNQLPRDFCVAVRGHKGWSRDPEASARYALVVSFEIVRQEIPIYEHLRVALAELRAEVEEVEIEVPLEE